MYLEALGRVELPREPEVDDLDLVAVGRDTEHVLGFEVEMKDVFGVHVRHRLADLTHEVDALTLRQEVVSVDDALKQLTARNAGTVRTSHSVPNAHPPFVWLRDPDTVTDSRTIEEDQGYLHILHIIKDHITNGAVCNKIQAVMGHFEECLSKESYNGVECGKIEWPL